jgi:hypothetical protein
MRKIQGKPNFGQIASFVVALFLTAIAMTFIFSSCSDARLVSIHLKKAEKHGGKIVCDTTFVEVPKLVKGKDGKDSLIYVSTPIPCKPCQPCETKREIKWKYKYDLKRQKLRDAFIIDSLNKLHEKELKLAKIEGKTTKRTIKSDEKKETANNKTANVGLIVFGIVGSLLLLLLILYKFKKK